jgi:class 3 adenylate cyclase
MFCDLAASTELSARLDPEDFRELLGTYHAAVREEIKRFGGFIAKYMGDGVLIYFGYSKTAISAGTCRRLRRSIGTRSRLAQGLAGRTWYGPPSPGGSERRCW